jgi:hypothetical protein
MRRVAINVLMFYSWLTAAANVLLATGVAESWGIDLPDNYESFERAGSNLSSVSVSGNIVESFTNVALAGFQTASGVLDVLTAAPKIMTALGVPPALVTFIHAPLALIVSVTLFYILTGREL